MLVLKRLAALAAAVTPGLLSGGAALAGSGQPSPWQMGFQQAATPVMDNIVWFHDFLLWLITAITLFVLVLLVDRDGALQRARQSDAVAHHAQHAARGDVDAGAGDHPGGDRGAVVQAAVPGADHPAGRRDREGDRQAVVLELQLSGQPSSSSTR